MSNLAKQPKSPFCSRIGAGGGVAFHVHRKTFAADFDFWRKDSAAFTNEVESRGGMGGLVFKRRKRLRLHEKGGSDCKIFGRRCAINRFLTDIKITLCRLYGKRNMLYINGNFVNFTDKLISKLCTSVSDACPDLSCWCTLNVKSDRDSIQARRSLPNPRTPKSKDISRQNQNFHRRPVLTTFTSMTVLPSPSS
jgi:hypothetical protein